MTSMERCTYQRWTGVVMWSLRQLKDMVEQETRDIVRFWSEPHGMVLEQKSTGRVMEEVCWEQIIMELFLSVGGYANDIFNLIIVIKDETLIFIINL